MEFGISTFGEIEADNLAGNAANANRRVQQLIEEAKLADRLGLDVFALGEHHRPDYVVSAPEIILSAIASVTEKIKLTSAVTVLSSADPVRVFQNFATLDLVSNGRAEIMAGRGSFIESFPLFGFDLDDYNSLFSEKLELLLQINNNEHVTWQGKHRSALQNAGVYPRPYQQRLPIWIAVGGTPASVIRAGSFNLPVTIAILGGEPERFAPLVDLYRSSAKRAGFDPAQLQLCINEHTYIAETSEQASDEFWPVYEKVMNRVGKERGWAPITRDYFEHLRSPAGSLLVGSADEVAEKLIKQYSIFHNTRFLAQTIMGNIAHEKMLHSIELFATKVVPAVNAAIK
jgi:probable LLM family oxidoreductase